LFLRLKIKTPGFMLRCTFIESFAINYPGVVWIVDDSKDGQKLIKSQLPRMLRAAILESAPLAAQPLRRGTTQGGSYFSLPRR
jgi:hypothetical protein